MNLQPAVDKLCVTCLAGLPYMESGLAEYSTALPSGKEEKEVEKEEEEGKEAGKGEVKEKGRRRGP